MKTRTNTPNTPNLSPVLGNSGALQGKKLDELNASGPIAKLDDLLRKKRQQMLIDNLRRSGFFK